MATTKKKSATALRRMADASAKLAGERLEALEQLEQRNVALTAEVGTLVEQLTAASSEAAALRADIETRKQKASVMRDVLRTALTHAKEVERENDELREALADVVDEEGGDDAGL